MEQLQTKVKKNSCTIDLEILVHASVYNHAGLNRFSVKTAKLSPQNLAVIIACLM